MKHILRLFFSSTLQTQGIFLTLTSLGLALLVMSARKSFVASVELRTVESLSVRRRDALGTHDIGLVRPNQDQTGPEKLGD